MNSAQRSAFLELMRIGGQMSNVCFNLSQFPCPDEPTWSDYRNKFALLQQQWDAARNRYFELEAEAKKARSTARTVSVRKSAKGG